MTKETGTVLTKSEILELIKGQPPLIEGYLNLDEQLQPNGIDLTLREVALMQSPGQIASSKGQRQIPTLAPLVYNYAEYIDLMPGPYIITINEIVNLPRNIMALARPRSSLLRCGVTIGTAVWDAGYSGRSQCLMVVHNPMGFTLQKDARVIQLIFFRLGKNTEGYNGIYQGENIA